MINTWNIVETAGEKTVWKNLEDTNISEIKVIENQAKSQPYFCKNTNSVVFKTNEPIVLNKGINYSELVLISRYLTTENNLYELLSE